MCIAEYRSDCAETIRCISSVYADVAFQYILERIEEQLVKYASQCDGGMLTLLLSILLEIRINIVAKC